MILTGEKMDHNTFNVVTMPSVDSTNNYVKFFIDRNLSVDRPLVLTAKRQTAGKGRYGKTFFSPEGGLYMSYCFELNNEDELDYLNYITPITAVLVRRVISKFVDDEVGIKWVNDIIVNDKKVGGILTEFEQTNIGASFVIIGIGINCYITERDLPLPENIKDTIGFLDIKDISALTDAITDELYKVFPFNENFDHKKYLEEYRKHCLTLGNKITVKHRSGATQHGFASDIDDEYKLIIKNDESGETTALSSVEASIDTIN